MAAAIRVLFFAEAVTLAHVARLIVLARSLDRKRYQVVMACSPRYRRFTDPEAWDTLPLDSIGTERFLRALATGNPVYDEQTLHGYVRQDLALIEQVRPDLIVGDFRLSLSASARVAGVRYATVTNAYWSPSFAVRRWTVPALPMTRMLPLSVADALFGWVRPLAFGLHCGPLNRVRRSLGLPTLGTDLRRVYTDADDTLYADSPALFPIDDLPSSQRYLGPILWSPPVDDPAWWPGLPSDKPIVYLTLGSSGAQQSTQLAMQALTDRPVTVIVSTAGAAVPRRTAPNIFVSDYLPGTQAAARSKLVVCNGGSPTSQQALAAGVPVLGIAGNLDQFLNMQAIVDAGAGVCLRGDRVGSGTIGRTVTDMLASDDLAAAAKGLASDFAAHDAPARFAAFVAEATGG